MQRNTVQRVSNVSLI